MPGTFGSGTFGGGTFGAPTVPTTYAGGMLDRLLTLSLWNMIEDTLDELGWRDTGRGLGPITIFRGSIDPYEPIESNTLAVSLEGIDDDPAELGSDATFDHYGITIDFFGATAATSKHVAGDVRDILRGKMPAAGRTAPRLDVLDYNLATPAVLFTAEIERVRSDPASGFTQEWLRYWRSITAVLTIEPF